MKRMLGVAAVLCVASAAMAQFTIECVDSNAPCYPKCGGEVNISGATLFQNFFENEASTFDFIDADCDGIASPAIPPDQLAFTGTRVPTWWIVSYRGVGSGNGLAEFVRSSLEPGWVPDSEPSDVGIINRAIWTGWPPPYQHTDPVHMGVMDVPTTWFVTNAGTGAWTRNPAEIGYGNNPLIAWNATKSNKLKSLKHPEFSDPNSPYFGATLNTNFADCDDKTVYDTPIAWVPISYIVNKGVGLGGCPNATGNVRASSLQSLFLHGRLANGENLIACTRDSGSGTRNGGMNTACIDPSYGVGDNLFEKSGGDDTSFDLLGPNFRWTNRGGSSRMEASVQNARLGLGYTGLVGSSRSIADVAGDKYELANVMFDIYPGACCVGTDCIETTMWECDMVYGGVFQGTWTECDPNPCTEPGALTARGGCLLPAGDCILTTAADCASQSGSYYGDNTTCYARPSLDGVLYNCGDNPNAWPIGGFETFATVGSPAVAEGTPGCPYPMADGPAKDYLNNIRLSIAGFVDAPADPNFALSPAEYMAGKWFMIGALTCVPDPLDPCRFAPNAELNASLRTWTSENNTGMNGVLPYCSFESRTPVREVLDGAFEWPVDNDCDCAYPETGTYSDGTNGSGGYRDVFGVVIGSRLNPRNILSGDFNGDGCRDADDICCMMAAYYDRYVLGDPTWPTYKAQCGPLDPNDAPSVDVIGDFNGDGNFDCRDVRYFADGLAMVDDPTNPYGGRRLDRKVGFVQVDTCWETLTGTDNNFFNTTVTGGTYVAGAAAYDVAGNTPWKGALPHGYDCVIDCEDVCYIYANFGTFPTDGIDLSCDVTGDLVVDMADVAAVEALIGPCDACGACCVEGECLVTTATECAGEYLGDGTNCTHFDFDCVLGSCCLSDGTCVDGLDIVACEGQGGVYQGFRSDCGSITCPVALCPGDANCDGFINFRDIDYFVAAQNDNVAAWEALFGGSAPCDFLNNDTNGDGFVNFRDIDPFVALQNTTCP